MRFIFKRIRFFFQITAIVLITIVDSLIVIFNMIFRERSYRFFKHYKGWSSRILRICRIKVEIYGEEKLDKKADYIYISNHSSMFDIPVLFSSINDEIRIIYKKELEKIPIFGYCLKKSPFIPIIRSEPREAMKSLELAISKMKDNISVLIFPEGTRSKDGRVQEFKRGGFLMALRSGKEIVPVTVKGTSEIMPSGRLYFEPQNVKVIIHTPIKYFESINKEQERNLMNQVRDVIINGLKENE